MVWECRKSPGWRKRFFDNSTNGRLGISPPGKLEQGMQKPCAGRLLSYPPPRVGCGRAHHETLGLEGYLVTTTPRLFYLPWRMDPILCSCWQLGTGNCLKGYLVIPRGARPSKAGDQFAAGALSAGSLTLNVAPPLGLFWQSISPPWSWMMP